jgi:hypothetical protein
VRESAFQSGESVKIPLASAQPEPDFPDLHSQPASLRGIAAGWLWRTEATYAGFSLAIRAPPRASLCFLPTGAFQETPPRIRTALTKRIQLQLLIVLNSGHW